MMKNHIEIYTWNINGLRSAIKKGFFDWIRKTKPDIICLQEIRMFERDALLYLKEIEGYDISIKSSIKAGYSGIATLTKKSPKNKLLNTGISEFDDEGRFILSEFEEFTLINCYVPNGRGNSRIDFKMNFLSFIIKILNKYKRKPIVLCGDFNIAHNEIDLHNPKINKNKTGFLEVERAFFNNLNKMGFLDIYRNHFPENPGYTWWNQSREFKRLNLGWRFDYFWISKKYFTNVIEIQTLSNVLLSDHCPLKVKLKVFQ